MYKHHRESWNYSQTNPFPNYNDMIKHTDERLLPLGFEKESIGLSQDGEFTMYAYKINLDKPVFWIDSNIHGSEWWTCYYCLDFIESVWNNSYFRSEEHTSELQSRFDLVCRLLLEKKNNNVSNLIRAL